VPSNLRKGRKFAMRDWDFSSNAEAIVAILLVAAITVIALA
jgi:hypothetical protein